MSILQYDNPASDTSNNDDSLLKPITKNIKINLVSR